MPSIREVLAARQGVQKELNDCLKAAATTSISQKGRVAVLDKLSRLSPCYCADLEDSHAIAGIGSTASPSAIRSLQTGIWGKSGDESPKGLTSDVVPLKIPQEQQTGGHSSVFSSSPSSIHGSESEGPMRSRPQEEWCSVWTAEMVSLWFNAILMCVRSGGSGGGDFVPSSTTAGEANSTGKLESELSSETVALFRAATQIANDLFRFLTNINRPTLRDETSSPYSQLTKFCLYSFVGSGLLTRFMDFLSIPGVREDVQRTCHFMFRSTKHFDEAGLFAAIFDVLEQHSRDAKLEDSEPHSCLVSIAINYLLMNQSASRAIAEDDIIQPLVGIFARGSKASTQVQTVAKEGLEILKQQATPQVIDAALQRIVEEMKDNAPKTASTTPAASDRKTPVTSLRRPVASRIGTTTLNRPQKSQIRQMSTSRSTVAIPGGFAKASDTNATTTTTTTTATTANSTKAVVASPTTSTSSSARLPVPAKPTRSFSKDSLVTSEDDETASDDIASCSDQKPGVSSGVASPSRLPRSQAAGRLTAVGRTGPLNGKATFGSRTPGGSATVLHQNNNGFFRKRPSIDSESTGRTSAQAQKTPTVASTASSRLLGESTAASTVAAQRTPSRPPSTTRFGLRRQSRRCSTTGSTLDTSRGGSPKMVDSSRDGSLNSTREENRSTRNLGSPILSAQNGERFSRRSASRAVQAPIRTRSPPQQQQSPTAVAVAQRRFSPVFPARQPGERRTSDGASNQRGDIRGGGSSAKPRKASEEVSMTAAAARRRASGNNNNTNITQTETATRAVAVGTPTGSGSNTRRQITRKDTDEADRPPPSAARQRSWQASATPRSLSKKTSSGTQPDSGAELLLLPSRHRMDSTKDLGSGSLGTTESRGNQISPSGKVYQQTMSSTTPSNHSISSTPRTLTKGPVTRSRTGVSPSTTHPLSTVLPLNTTSTVTTLDLVEAGATTTSARQQRGSVLESSGALPRGRAAPSPGHRSNAATVSPTVAGGATASATRSSALRSGGSKTPRTFRPTGATLRATICPTQLRATTDEDLVTFPMIPFSPSRSHMRGSCGAELAVSFTPQRLSGQRQAARPAANLASQFQAFNTMPLLPRQSTTLEISASVSTPKSAKQPRSQTASGLSEVNTSCSTRASTNSFNFSAGSPAGGSGLVPSLWHDLQSGSGSSPFSSMADRHQLQRRRKSPTIGDMPMPHRSHLRNSTGIENEGTFYVSIASYESSAPNSLSSRSIYNFRQESMGVHNAPLSLGASGMMLHSGIRSGSKRLPLALVNGSPRFEATEKQGKLSFTTPANFLRSESAKLSSDESRRWLLQNSCIPMPPLRRSFEVSPLATQRGSSTPSVRLRGHHSPTSIPELAVLPMSAPSLSPPRMSHFPALQSRNDMKANAVPQVSRGSLKTEKKVVPSSPGGHFAQPSCSSASSTTGARPTPPSSPATSAAPPPLLSPRPATPPSNHRSNEYTDVTSSTIPTTPLSSVTKGPARSRSPGVVVMQQQHPHPCRRQPSTTSNSTESIYSSESIANSTLLSPVLYGSTLRRAATERRKPDIHTCASTINLQNTLRGRLADRLRRSSAPPNGFPTNLEAVVSHKAQARKSRSAAARQENPQKTKDIPSLRKSLTQGQPKRSSTGGPDVLLRAKSTVAPKNSYHADLHKTGKSGSLSSTSNSAGSLSLVDIAPAVGPGAMWMATPKRPNVFVGHRGGSTNISGSISQMQQFRPLSGKLDDAANGASPRYRTNPDDSELPSPPQTPPSSGGNQLGLVRPLQPTAVWMRPQGSTPMRLQTQQHQQLQPQGVPLDRLGQAYGSNVRASPLAQPPPQEPRGIVLPAQTFVHFHNPSMSQQQLPQLVRPLCRQSLRPVPTVTNSPSARQLGAQHPSLPANVGPPSSPPTHRQITQAPTTEAVVAPIMKGPIRVMEARRLNMPAFTHSTEDPASDVSPTHSTKPAIRKEGSLARNAQQSSLHRHSTVTFTAGDVPPPTSDLRSLHQLAHSSSAYFHAKDRSAGSTTAKQAPRSVPGGSTPKGTGPAQEVAPQHPLPDPTQSQLVSTTCTITSVTFDTAKYNETIELETSEEAIGSLQVSQALAKLEPKEDRCAALRSTTEDDSDWKAKLDALNSIRRAARFNPEALQQLQTSRKSMQGILKCVDSLRSSVAKRGLLCVRDLFVYCQKFTDPSVDLVIASCLRRASDPSNAFLCEEADRALYVVCFFASEARVAAALTPKLAGCRNPWTRLKGAKCFGIILWRLRRQVSKLRTLPDILPTLIQLANDPLPEARSVGKACLCWLHCQFPSSSEFEKYILKPSKMKEGVKIPHRGRWTPEELDDILLPPFVQEYLVAVED